jgi:hypothetical protein
VIPVRRIAIPITTIAVFIVLGSGESGNVAMATIFRKLLKKLNNRHGIIVIERHMRKEFKGDSAQMLWLVAHLLSPIGVFWFCGPSEL